MTWTLAMRNRVLLVVEDEGTLALSVPQSGILVCRVGGILSQEMAGRWIEVLHSRLQGGQVFATFMDWELMSSYDSEARRQLTSWGIKNARNFARGTHCLVGSKIVAMGIATAGLSLSLVGVSLTTYASRTKFETALAAAL